MNSTLNLNGFCIPRCHLCLDKFSFSFSNSRIYQVARESVQFLQEKLTTRNIQERVVRQIDTSVSVERAQGIYSYEKEPLIENLNKDQPLASLASRDQEAKRVIESLLEAAHYQVVNPHYDLIYRMRLIAASIETNQGRKFVKLHNKSFGLQEYQGCLLAEKYLPVVKSESLISSQNFELVVQPYVEGIDQDRGMLFDVIGKLESSESISKEKYWDLFNAIFKGMYVASSQSLEYGVKEAGNDRLYMDRLKTQQRDDQSGSIEKFYSNSQINLGGQLVAWDQLLDKKWSVDGEEYQETLRELLEKARQTLDPSKQRLTSISQGDWHEMNIFTNILDEKIKNPSFSYLDFEMAGSNSLIGDAMVFLFYLSIYADYIGPKYYAEQFSKSPKAMSIIQEHHSLKTISPSVQEKEGTVHLSGIGNFGTSSIRKQLTKKFIENYLKPITQFAIDKFGPSVEHQIERTLQSCLLLRILGPCNVSKMDAMDQGKIFGLLFKSLGTKKNGDSSSTLNRFYESL